MSYTWQWMDRQTGELHDITEPGTPCCCQGDDLPHPPRLCAAIRQQHLALRMCMCGAGGLGDAHVHGAYLSCPPLDVVVHTS